MREVLHEGRFLRLIRDGRWEYAERTNSPGAVLVAGVTADDELLLVEEFRTPIGAPCIGLPAGIAGDAPGHEDEAFVTAARRELLEETGYEAASLAHVSTCAANPGMDAEILHFFVARGLRRVADGGGDGTENITVHRVPMATVHAWLDQRRQAGAAIAQNVYVGLYLLGL